MPFSSSQFAPFLSEQLKILLPKSQNKEQYVAKEFPEAD
jgi:hypothetical protein